MGGKSYDFSKVNVKTNDLKRKGVMEVKAEDVKIEDILNFVEDKKLRQEYP